MIRFYTSATAEPMQFNSQSINKKVKKDNKSNICYRKQ